MIELYRKDGIEAAQEFAALMLPHRLMAASLGHSTAPALRAALQLVCTEPGTIQNDEQAFAAALRIGRTGAEYTFRRFARGTGRSDMLEAQGFKDVSTALDAALERAVQAFHAGRYENNAATLRASDQVASAGDYACYTWKPVTVYVTKEVPYTVYVTKYDHCGYPYQVQVTKVKYVQVAVTKYVKVYH